MTKNNFIPSLGQIDNYKYKPSQTQSMTETLRSKTVFNCVWFTLPHEHIVSSTEDELCFAGD